MVVGDAVLHVRFALSFKFVQLTLIQPLCSCFISARA